MHRVIGIRHTGGFNTGSILRSTENGVKGIPGNRVTGIHVYFIPEHCVFRFQTAKLGGSWIMDPVEMALVEW